MNWYLFILFNLIIMLIIVISSIAIFPLSKGNLYLDFVEWDSVDYASMPYIYKDTIPYIRPTIVEKTLTHSHIPRTASDLSSQFCSKQPRFAVPAWSNALACLTHTRDTPTSYLDFPPSMDKGSFIALASNDVLPVSQPYSTRQTFDTMRSFYDSFQNGTIVAFEACAYDDMYYYDKGVYWPSTRSALSTKPAVHIKGTNTMVVFDSALTVPHTFEIDDYIWVYVCGAMFVDVYEGV